MTDSRPGIRRHIRLTSHPGGDGDGRTPLVWGAAGAALRGPVVASPANPRHRNAIGSHSGSYAIYRALAVATGALAPDHRPDLTDTAPAAPIGPWPQWADPAKIVSLDPYGHLVGEVFAAQIRADIDARPTIAITTARIDLPEIRQRIAAGDIVPDGRVVLESGEVRVTKAAIDPVWYLPGIAARFGVAEPELRRTLFAETGGMFPELVTRPDLAVFLPPIGGTTVYLFGDVARIGQPDTLIACRVHDECNGSDVFGSDICTCRPYLAHGVEVCATTAQEGGVGLARDRSDEIGSLVEPSQIEAEMRQAILEPDRQHPVRPLPHRVGAQKGNGGSRVGRHGNPGPV